MNSLSLVGETDRPSYITPTIELHVAGPRNDAGFVLRAPRDEALVWDLENEVVTSRRVWLPEREAWWIAASYLQTVLEVVLRSFPSVLLLDATAGDHLVSRDGSRLRQERLL